MKKPIATKYYQEKTSAASSSSSSSTPGFTRSSWRVGVGLAMKSSSAKRQRLSDYSFSQIQGRLRLRPRLSFNRDHASSTCHHSSSTVSAIIQEQKEKEKKRKKERRKEKIFKRKAGGVGKCSFQLHKTTLSLHQQSLPLKLNSRSLCLFLFFVFCIFTSLNKIHTVSVPSFMTIQQAAMNHWHMLKVF